MNQNEALSIVIGSSNGGRLITGTDAVTGEWNALVVNEDCVINAILVDGVDVTTARGYAAKTITAGMFIGAGLNYIGGAKNKITSVDLTSGSVMAY